MQESLFQNEEIEKEPIDLCISDYEGLHVVDLEEIDVRTTIGELVLEAIQRLDLHGTMFQPVFQGRQLALSDSVAEAGLRSGDRIELFPDVHAGSSGDC